MTLNMELREKHRHGWREEREMEEGEEREYTHTQTNSEMPFKECYWEMIATFKTKLNMIHW